MIVDYVCESCGTVQALGYDAAGGECHYCRPGVLRVLAARPTCDATGQYDIEFSVDVDRMDWLVDRVEALEAREHEETMLRLFEGSGQ